MSHIQGGAQTRLMGSMDSCSGTRSKDDPDTRVGHRGLGIKHQCSGQGAEAQRRGTSTFQELAQ